MQLYTTKSIENKHAFTTREGGVSDAPFNTFNLAYHVGDSRDAVMRNHRLLAHEMGYDLKKLCFMNQIHSNKVEIVDEDSFSVPSCDALVTALPDTPLMVMGADCAGVLLEEKSAGVIAAAHVGRAGAFGDILSNVVTVMQKRFGADTSKIKVAVGPRLRVCCHEVGVREIEEAKRLGYGFALHGNRLDIDAIIASQLEKNGIEEENVEFLPHCTRCESERFFSYRAAKETGRNAGVIVRR